MWARRRRCCWPATSWAARKGRKICRAATSSISRRRWKTSMVLADTGYWLALANRRDHSRPSALTPRRGSSNRSPATWNSTNSPRRTSAPSKRSWRIRRSAHGLGGRFPGGRCDRARGRPHPHHRPARLQRLPLEGWKNTKPFATCWHADGRQGNARKRSSPRPQCKVTLRWVPPSPSGRGRLGINPLARIRGAAGLQEGSCNSSMPKQRQVLRNRRQRDSGGRAMRPLQILLG